VNKARRIAAIWLRDVMVQPGYDRRQQGAT